MTDAQGVERGLVFGIEVGFLTNPSMVTGKRQRAWCSHLLSVAPQMRDAGRFWQITFHGHEVIVANSRVRFVIMPCTA